MNPSLRPLAWTLVCALAPLASSALAAASVTASSQITAVTVYTDRAIVTRSGTAELTAGENEIVFEKLPLQLLDDSIQVSAEGTGGTTILDVNSRNEFVANTPDARVKGLEDELQAEQKKLRTANDRRSILEQQKALLGRIENAVASPPGKESEGAARYGFDDWQKLMNFAEENRTKLASEQLEIEEQRREIQARIDALNAQLGDLRRQGGNDRGFKRIAVRVKAATAGHLTLALSYTVNGASWAPSYDARLRSEDRTLELSYFGSVRQNTGEDWRNVALTLSTARPSLGGSAPELSPWIVDVYQPRQMASEEIQLRSFALAEKKTLGVSLADRRQEAPAAAAPVAAQMATATVSEAATSASFKIEGATTVLSDNTPQKVGIASEKLEARLEYRASPRLAETAFLNAEVRNTTEYPLLAGNMNTFLGESFVSTSSLRTVMPGEKFDLALGADEGISIKRRLVNRFTEQTGLTNSGRRIGYEFLTTVTNNKRVPAHVVVKDTIPVSRNERISVNLQVPSDREIGTAEKPREIMREADGRLVWNLDLKPGEKREIRLKFNIEHPADVPVTGIE